MKVNSLETAFIAALSILLVSCGGGDESNSNSDVAIYGSCGNTPNYLSTVGRDRWKSFPLTVAIDLSAAPRVNEGNNSTIYLRAIQAGAAGWNVGSGIGIVSFVSGRDADIVIRFSSLPTNVLGQTFPVIQNNYISKGTRIDLSANAFSVLASSTFLEREVFLVTLHEMGHALFASGLSGNAAHSPFTDDVMAEFNQARRDNLSQRDINSIREAYCQRR